MRSTFQNPITEDVDEFGKVGAGMSYRWSQMPSHYDSAESIADSDLEDGELRKMLASPLYMQSREDCKSSRRPTAPEKPAAMIQERGACAKRAHSRSKRKLDVKFVAGTESIGDTCCNVVTREQRTGKPIQEFCFQTRWPVKLWTVYAMACEERFQWARESAYESILVTYETVLEGLVAVWLTSSVLDRQPDALWRMSGRGGNETDTASICCTIDYAAAKFNWLFFRITWRGSGKRSRLTVCTLQAWTVWRVYLQGETSRLTVCTILVGTVWHLRQENSQPITSFTVCVEWLTKPCPWQAAGRATAHMASLSFLNRSHWEVELHWFGLRHRAQIDYENWHDETFELPHRLRVQTRIRPTNSLTETSSLLAPNVFIASFMILVVAPPEWEHSVWIDVLPGWTSSRWHRMFPLLLEVLFWAIFPVRRQWIHDVSFQHYEL